MFLESEPSLSVACNPSVFCLGICCHFGAVWRRYVIGVLEANSPAAPCEFNPPLWGTESLLYVKKN